MKKSWTDIRFVAFCFAVWRLALLLVGLPGFRLLTFKASFPQIDEMLISSHFPQWIWQWGNFDGVHYLDIAQNGYHGSGLQVFFPVYPLLIKIVSFVIPNYFLSGFLIANVSFFLALIFFLRLVRKYFNDSVAKWSVISLLVFPTSFYFGAVYTESLFFLLLMIALLYDGPLSWAAAMFTSLTRLIGVFIAPAYLFLRRNILSLIFPAIGLLLFMGYLQVVFHNPLYFLSGQAAFKNARASSLSSLVLPPQVIYRYIKIFLTDKPGHYDFWVAVMEFVSFFFGIGVLTYQTWKKKIPSGFLVYSWFALLLPSFSGTLSSMPRYLLTIFPVFIYLGSLKNRILRVAVLSFCAIILAVLTVLFTRGYWVG